MNSEVIKFVAGAGKTTYSKEYLKNNSNGIYLAFNNSVVNEVSESGYLAKTIDSLFQSFIIPKFTSVVPIIANGSTITYLDEQNPTGTSRGLSQYGVGVDGVFTYIGKKISFNVNVSNDDLHRRRGEKYAKSLIQIFKKNELKLSNKLRSELTAFLLNKYPEQIKQFISSRFDYVIVDEAQDLSGAKEEFVKLLYEQDMKMIILGDENQNINGGGPWFESLTPTKTVNVSHRCPENVCKWIRDNLKIDIYGNDNNGEFHQIEQDDVINYDDEIRMLLYNARSGNFIKNIADAWKGPKSTIKSVKGSTIETDIVIIGDSLNTKSFYTAITRTTCNVYSTIKKWNI